MTCCDVVSVGRSRLHAACVDRNGRNRNILVFSHIVTVTCVKLDGRCVFIEQLKIIFITDSSAHYFLDYLFSL